MHVITDSSAPAKTDKRQFTVIEIEVMSKLYGYRHPIYIQTNTTYTTYYILSCMVISECGIDASSMCILYYVTNMYFNRLFNHYTGIIKVFRYIIRVKVLWNLALFFKTSNAMLIL